jgi:hypothetical protein
VEWPDSGEACQIEAARLTGVVDVGIDVTEDEAEEDEKE